MAYRVPTRADDEVVLSMLMQRHEGRSTYQIAEDFGKRPQNVRTTLDRVRDHDEKFVGRDLSSEYWERRA